MVVMYADLNNRLFLRYDIAAIVGKMSRPLL
ncbi:MAG: hypothetical protein JWP38_221 [Herbaspirillum sp.]|nr:hypothetical protein [Herbaspirillum sp.]